MAKTLYKYIEDDVLIEKVQAIFNVLDAAQSNIDSTLHSNVIDPFSAILESSYHDMNYEEWIATEKVRQLQKTFQNEVGYFHQHIIDGFEGWEDIEGGGYDVENKDKKIIGEIKNKHNTMNSGSAEAAYTKMVSFLDDFKKGYTGYVITVIPKGAKRFCKNFNPKVRGENLPERDDLKIIDGASFYELITGDEDALKLLYEAMPKVIKACLDKKKLRNDADEAKFKKLFTLAFGD